MNLIRKFKAHIGSPRMLLASGPYHGNQHYDLKQIVPNSRLIVVPPKDDGINWQSRLYLTPSQVCRFKRKILILEQLEVHNYSNIFVKNQLQFLKFMLESLKRISKVP